jgi:hypothetical protein
MRLTQKHYVYTGLFALFVISVFILYIGYVGYSPINHQTVARIQRGMTEQQVEEILGGPCDHAFHVPENTRLKDRPVQMKFWHDPHGARCSVWFDAGERVVFVGYQEPPNRGVVGLIRDALRLH